MEFVSIFADENNECGVFSVIFNAEELNRCGIDKDAFDFDEEYFGENEYRKALELFTNDVLYLDQFFEDNCIYFKNEFWNGITKEEFIKKVRNAAYCIHIRIKTAFQEKSLDQLFQPLKDSDCRQTVPLQQTKAKFDGQQRIKLLRLYAIKIDTNTYCITGGCIKIARTMQDARNSQIELNKLNYVSGYLRHENVFDADSFIDIILEK